MRNIDYFDLYGAMGESEVYEACLDIYKDTNGDEDTIINYLSELASYVYSCPDACDMWACEYY